MKESPIKMRNCFLYSCNTLFQIDQLTGRNKIYCSDKCARKCNQIKWKIQAMVEMGMSKEEARIKLKIPTKQFYELIWSMRSLKNGNTVFFVPDPEQRVPDEDYLLTHRAKYPPMNYALPTQESETIGEFYRKEIA